MKFSILVHIGIRCAVILNYFRIQPASSIFKSHFSVLEDERCHIKRKEKEKLIWTKSIKNY